MSEATHLNGRKVFAIFATGFGIIISVNVFMAFQAVSTFPGVEVQKSYAHSQTFDDRRSAQDALGWDLAVRIEGDMLHLDMSGPDGRVVRPSQLQGLFGIATTQANDQQLQWVETATGFAAPIYADDLKANWALRLNARSADGTVFKRRIVIRNGQG